MNKDQLKGFGSRCVHDDTAGDAYHAHLPPIYASSTYVFDSAEQGMDRFSGKEEGYIYSRWGNPTITAVEKKIASLEAFGLTNDNGEQLELKSILHASGMAAISTLLLGSLKSGDKILTHYSLYGGTQEMIDRILPHYGIEAIVEDLKDLNKAEEIINNDPRIRMLYLETPANPTIQCVDIEALTEMAKRNHITVAADNTFATPYLQQPFKFGVDYVVHSTTKFLNGHGTAVGGVLLGKDINEMNGWMTKAHRLFGGNGNPFEAFLLNNGIKTLELRMQRHCDNAMKVAHFLDNHEKVGQVNYLGLESHPDYELAKKQMKHPGPMLSFELKKGFEAGKKFINRLQTCIRAVSLGTCDSLICHPASMTHFGVAKEQRERYGITDGLMRMSVGIENTEDILADLEQALSAI